MESIFLYQLSVKVRLYLICSCLLKTKFLLFINEYDVLDKELNEKINLSNCLLNNLNLFTTAHNVSSKHIYLHQLLIQIQEAKIMENVNIGM